VRPLAKPGERGTLEDILQPGVYFTNPKLQKITLIEIGFNEFSTTNVPGGSNYQISFPSDTGFLIRVGVTVVWGIDPRHAA
jgi:SPFH domain / Band 7 family